MKTSIGIAIALAIIIVVFGFFGRSILATIFAGSARSSSVTQHIDASSSTTTPATSVSSAAPAATTKAPASAHELLIKDNIVGTGATAQSGDTVSVLYEGMLQNGKVFDSSKAHGNKPLSFKIGAHRVILGMEQGVIGMKVGGTRTIIIPPSLGYGTRGYGPIPGNATLIFKVQLVKEAK